MKCNILSLTLIAAAAVVLQPVEAFAWGCSHSSSGGGSRGGSFSHSGSTSGGWGGASHSGSTSYTGRGGNTYSTSHSGSASYGGGYHYGELLGTVSKNKMNREVGGFGHDPKTEPLEAHIETNNPCCFEDQTVAEAEQMMLDAQVGEVPVVTREKLLVGTISIEAIAQEKRWRNAWNLLKYCPAAENATIGCSMPLLHPE